ncbi:MAG: nitroreductase family protein [Candidatus Aenigmarchaeota archaeon]|nr:nitroreductase family protein [Candidatus Aenigmarchaeota archaeon]
MDTLECIKTRRSRRKFLDKEVSDEIIEKIIDFARYAPFGGPLKKECQVWEFVVVKDRETIKELALGYEDREFLFGTPVVIACCTDKTKDPEYKEWTITMSLAMENILLTTHSLGLGACFITTFTKHEKHKDDREKMIKILELPENIELIGMIALGYPDDSEVLEKKDLRDLKEVIHCERW